MESASETTPARELQVITPAEVGQLAPLDAPPGVALYNPENGPLAFWCNWDTKTDEGQVEAMRCLNGADKRLADMIGEVFEMRSAFIQPVSLVSEETGEVNDCPRVVLVAPDGTLFGCVSTGVFNSLRAIMGMKGRGPWNPPIKVKVRQVSTRAGRRTFVLDLVLTPPPPTAGKEAKPNGRK